MNAQRRESLRKLPVGGRIPVDGGDPHVNQIHLANERPAAFEVLANALHAVREEERGLVFMREPALVGARIIQYWVRVE